MEKLIFPQLLFAIDIVADDRFFSSKVALLICLEKEKENNEVNTKAR